MDEGHVRYNTYLLVVALKLGIEKVWVPDNCLPVNESIIMEAFSWLYPNGKVTLGLKELCQSNAMFEYLAEHSPKLEIVHLPRSDTPSFQNLIKYK